MLEREADKPRCLNCDSILGGQYCGQCGQRADARLISLWQLLKEAFGDLFELDSRLWRTLIPLLVRPGMLTRDYLQGRRARFMPPFRMYLVLSLLFFLIAFFNPREKLAIFYLPTAEETSPAADDLADDAEASEIRRAVLDELVAEGLLEPDQRDAAIPQPPGEEAPSAPSGAEVPDDAGINLTVDEDSGELECNVGENTLDELPGFLSRRLTKERLHQVCLNVQAAGVTGFLSALLDNIPAALIVLLPLMALALKILYPLSRRFYVEHLLFFVHFHSFMFLLLTLQILWARLLAAFSLHTALIVLPLVATSLYMPVYLYKSMRRVYNQGGLLTFAKFLVLSTTYLVGLIILFAFAALLAVFSV